MDVQLSGLPPGHDAAILTHYRIDRAHSNSYQMWLDAGSPLPLSPDQSAQLETAGHLAELTPPQRLVIADGKAEVKLTLPRQGGVSVGLDLAVILNLKITTPPGLVKPAFSGNLVLSRRDGGY